MVAKLLEEACDDDRGAPGFPEYLATMPRAAWRRTTDHG